MTSWQLSGFGDEIDPDPVVQLGVLQALGARHIEVRSAWHTNVVELAADRLDRLAALIADRGMAVSAVASPVGKVSVLDEPAAELARLDRAVAAAHRLGSRYVRLFSFYRPAGLAAAEIRDPVVRRMRDFASIAEREGIVLLHENEKDIYGDTPERVLDLIESVGSAALRVAWDSANFVQVGVRPFTDGYRRLRPYLEYLQVKDAIAATGEVVPAGAGDGELIETLTALRDDGYAGFASLEPHLTEQGALGGFSGPAAFGRAARAFAALTGSIGVRLDPDTADPDIADPGAAERDAAERDAIVRGATVPGAAERDALVPVVIVGAGIIGANHAAAILRHPRLRIVALVDPVPAASGELARRIADRTGAAPPARYATLAEALADREVRLVAVCTPTGLHAAVAEEALAAGAHVVLEKPLDVSLRGARRLTELAAHAASRGLVTSVISQHRFDPATRAVAEAIAAGRLGRLTSAVATVPWWRGQGYYDSADWRGTRRLDGGGALMNQGVHTVDLLVWLLGRPVEVFARTARLAHRDIEVEDVAVATISFRSGALAALHATTAAYPGLGVRLQVHGTGGSAVIEDDQLAYFHAAADPGGSPPSTSEPGGPTNQAAGLVPAGELHGAPKPADGFVVGHLRQYEDIVEAIDRRRPPGVGIEDGLLALAVVEAVYHSATLGRPISVDDVLRGAFDDAAATPGTGERR